MTLRRAAYPAPEHTLLYSHILSFPIPGGLGGKKRRYGRQWGVINHPKDQASGIVLCVCVYSLKSTE